MTTGRPKSAIVLNDDERAYLKEILQDDETPQVARNVAIVLLEGEKGTTLQDLYIMDGLGKKAVNQIRRAFSVDGINCLNYGPYLHPAGVSYEESCSWDFNPEIVKNVLYFTQNEAPPEGKAQWSTRSLGDRLGISRTTVSLIWRAYRISPEKKTRTVDEQTQKEWDQVLNSDLYTEREKDRVRLVRMHCQGSSTEEIAETLGISKSTIWNWVNKFLNNEPIYKERALSKPIPEETQREWDQILAGSKYPDYVKTRIRIVRMHSEGVSYREIMTALKASRSTVQNWIRYYKEGKPLY
jgi:DNA invertase Pin-like site-specific DNA recombinase